MQEKAINKLEGAVDTEHTISRCLGHLETLIKNGKVRAQFHESADTARKNKDFFLSILNRLRKDEIPFEKTCTYCRINPASFSLQGSLNICLEISEIAIRYYKDIIALTDSDEEKALLKEMLSGKMRQRALLKREKKFSRKEEDKPDSGDSFDIPEFVLRLYR